MPSNIYQSEFTGEQMDARFAAVAELQSAVTALETAVAAKYAKPADGIPSTDMDAAVQNALAKALTAVQSLADYYTKSETDALLAAIAASVNATAGVTAASLPTASASTVGKMYYIGPDGNGEYARYVTAYDGTNYSWLSVGTTDIDLTQYATKAELNQLDQKVNNIYGEAVIPETYTFPGVNGVISFDPITIAQDGDGIEVDLLTPLSASDAAKGFAFAMNGTSQGVALNNNIVSIKNSAGSWVSGMNGGSADYNYTTGNSLSLNTRGKLKVVNHAGTLEVYIKDTLVHSVASFTDTIRITHIGGPYNSTNYWQGTIYSFKYTHGGITKNIYELPGYSVSGDVSFTSHTETSGLLTQKVDKIEGKGLSTNDFSDKEKGVVDVAVGLGWGRKLNGIDSYITLGENVVLSQNGDSLEFDLVVNTDGPGTDGGYAFGVGGRPNGLGIGVSKVLFSVISDDGTWIILNGALQSATNQTLKIEYADNKIKCYRNGTLVETYNGQKTITLKGFGNAWSGDAGFWDGVIMGMKVNGVAYDFAGATFYKADVYRPDGFLFPKQAAALDSLNPAIVIVPNDSTHFSVKVLNRATGTYLVHTFERSQGTRTINGVTYNCLDVWYADNISVENGPTIFQGNLNLIYMVGAVNGQTAQTLKEDGHVGPSHGCEVMQFFKFFADGKPFVPGTDTEEIACSTFRAIWKSTCYVIDTTESSANVNNYPKIVGDEMVPHAIHYLDATYKADNVIDWTNRLVQVRDASVQYSMLCGGMVQGYMATITDVMINDIENSWNKVSAGTEQAVFSIPEGYESVNLLRSTRKSDTVVMFGGGAIIRHHSENADNSKRDHAVVYTFSNNGSSAKCYIEPILPTSEQSPDTFVAGDVIEVYEHREIEYKES